MSILLYFIFNFQVQSLEIVVEEGNFVGMTFVLLSGGNWVKDRGSDFYVEFGSQSKLVQKVKSESECPIPITILRHSTSFPSTY